ncbi:MFS transporter [Burkholderia anthina]|uniref:MFS transporter n=1 Tax=Burkholderia anthina TaxID=179879 RepID=UPI00158EEFEE
MSTVAPVEVSAPPPPAAPSSPPAVAAFGIRLATGLAGVLLAVVIAQINDHVAEAALPDLRGALGLSVDQGLWFQTWYQVTQVCAMMFAPWCSATFSIRRFTMSAVGVFAVLAVILSCLPTDTAPAFVMALRAAQGLAGGCLPPMLMTVALRFLPPGIKLYGLGAYALTATFAPNLGTPLAALWLEGFGWRFAFLQVVPLCALSIAMVCYGLPQDPLRLERFRQFDWLGVLLGLPAMAMLVIVLEQGTHLGWTDSPMIVTMALSSVVLFVCFFINEWSHPLPFFKIQLLARRNLTHGLICVGGVLVILVALPGLPANYLAEVWHYRPLELSPLALCVALPQLIALPAVAALCNLRRVDCRWVLATGLALLFACCALGSFMSADWIRDNFIILQVIQVAAQPMSVIPLLMLATNGMSPAEGPFASSWFNTVKGLAGVVGAAVTEGVVTMRERVHSNVLVDHLGNALAVVRPHLSGDGQPLARLAATVHEQALVLASADVFRLMGIIALLLVLLTALLPTRIFPPRPAAGA